MNPKSIEAVRKDCETSLGEHIEKLRPLKGAELVVTGGTGFMGTWIAEAVTYLNDQHAFGTRLTLIARGTATFAVERPHLANRDDVTLVSSDIRHTFEVPRDTQWLIHAAATPDTRYHATHPVEAMSVIADGTSAILRAIDRCGDFRKMLHISSGLVYGACPMELERIPETYNGGPTVGSVSSAYAEAKRYAETYCASARSQNRIPIVTARPFAFVGPYQSLETPWAISHFIRDALAGNPIRVQGDGQSVRSYLYGSDMAAWLLRILTAGEPGAAYNVGSPVGVRLEELAQKVAGHFTPRPEILLRVSGSNSQQRSRLVPDVGLAERNLALGVRVDLESALRKAIEWNRNLRIERT